MKLATRAITRILNNHYDGKLTVSKAFALDCLRVIVAKNNHRQQRTRETRRHLRNAINTLRVHIGELLNDE